MIIKYEIPDEGSHAATITKLTNLGLVYSKFGKNDVTEITFQLSEPGLLGKPLSISRKYTKSIHASAALGKLVRALNLYENYATPVNVSKLIGKACTVVIRHKVRYGMTHAIVNAAGA